MRSTVAMVRPMIRRSLPRLHVAMYSRSLSIRRSNFIFGVGFAPPPTNLRQTGHAGFDAVAAGVTMADRLERSAADAGAGGMRTGPDQRHRAHRDTLSNCGNSSPRCGEAKRRPASREDRRRVACGHDPGMTGTRMVRNFSMTNGCHSGRYVLPEQGRSFAGQTMAAAISSISHPASSQECQSQDDVRHSFDENVARSAERLRLTRTERTKPDRATVYRCCKRGSQN